VIDTSNNQLVGSPIDVGDNPFGVAAHPDNTRVYVANFYPLACSGGNSVSVIDTASNTRIDTNPSTLKVDDIQLAPACTCEDDQGQSISLTCPTPTPFLGSSGMAVHPNGAWVYVANQLKGTVSVIDTTNNSKINFSTASTDIEVGGSPFGVAVHPTDDKVYVTDASGTTLFVLEFTLPPPALPPVTNVTVGNGPRGVAVTPNGSFVYVANLNDDTVSVVATATKTVIATVPVGNEPVTFGKFIGPADRDGDGITDPVDFDQNGINDESTVFSDNFSDKQLGGQSFGFIDNRDFDGDGSDLVVSVWDAFNDVIDPDGLWVRASGGGAGQEAEVKGCNLSVNVKLTDGDVGLITCSSLILQVLVGPIEILLDANAFVSVPSGGIVEVTEGPPGQFTIENLGSIEITIVDSQGQVIASIAPGSSGTFPSATDSCPDDPTKTDPGICGCGVADTDSDSDGTADCNDTCPNDANNDADGDSVCGNVDNCPTVANSDQANSDGDSLGDACDNCTDTDGDGFGNPGFPANTCSLDNCPADPGPGNGCPVVTPPADSDSDGLVDDEDTCPNSDTSATVVIDDSCDTGVDNDLTANGCTISDLVAGCEEGATDHGQYVSCVAQVTNDLKGADIITGKDKGAIQSCAAQADIP
jgi:YVTN family beta-propeller protein